MAATRWTTLAFALAFAAAAPLSAAAEPLTLHYSASWGGGPAARIQLQLEQDDRAFRNQLDIETVGLARWLSGFRARAISAGAVEAAVAPHAYDAVYDLRRKRDKRVQVQFVRQPGGTVAEDGPLDTDADTPLPEMFRRDVIDPLACITAIRRLIQAQDLAAVKRFSFAVYDGRRRFDVEGAVVATGAVRWTGAKIATIDLRLQLRPVAGFDGDRPDAENPDARMREVDVSFTNDARAIPLRMAVPIAYVPAIIALDRDTIL
jgi:hypothetical protein